jgi:hypothetical protein
VTQDTQQGAQRLRGLPRSELLAMYAAAAEATACLAAMAGRGTNPATEAISGAAVVEEWAHFPHSDVVDPATHSRYYYHAHSADERVPGEHGHFHTFVRTADSAGSADAFAHLIGISTDASGGVFRLFTVNRWVTDETWFDADVVCCLLDRFDLTNTDSSPDLNRWVQAIMRMFRPQIEHLIRARDASVAAFRDAHPSEDVFENRALRVTSDMSVDLLAQIRAIELALSGDEASSPTA